MTAANHDTEHSRGVATVPARGVATVPARGRAAIPLHTAPVVRVQPPTSPSSAPDRPAIGSDEPTAVDSPDRTVVAPARTDPPPAPSRLRAAAGRLTATVRADRPDTAWDRLLVSALSLLAVLAAAIGALSGVDTVRAVGVIAYLMFGTGAAPWALRKRMSLSLRLTVSVLGSLGTLVLVATAMLVGGVWHPLIAAGALGVLTVPMHLAGAVVAGREVRPQLRRRPRPAVSPALLALLGGGLLCLVAALTHRHLQPGIWGFLVQIGPWWYAGMALILISLAMSRSAGERTLAVGVLLVMLLLTGTPALVYDGPRSQSASKHLEFVEQIRAYHEMRSTVAVYNGWPGYFAAMAWLSDVARLRDPLGLAIAWPVLIGLGRIAAMRYFAGQLIKDRRRVWVAVLLGVLADPIGADYFSPQSLGFVLGLVVFGLALSRVRTLPKALAMTVAGSAVTVSHQLSPYLIGGALVVLVVFRQVRPWWLPATVLGPAVVWAALHWADLRNFLSLGDVGNASNFRPPETVATDGLSRQPVVTATVVALIAGVVLVGLIAALVVVRRRRDRQVWALALCPGVGLVIIATNPYGNEGIFRTILFGLPWLAILAAQALPASVPRGRTPGGRLRGVDLPLAVVAVALAVTFCVAAFGLDATNVLRPQDRAAFTLFRGSNPQSAEPSYLMVVGPGDLPSSPPSQQLKHVAIKRNDIDPTGWALDAEAPPATVRRLTDAFVAYAGGPSEAARLYVVWSPVSSWYGWEYGLHTRPQFAALRDAFAASPRWHTVYSEGGTMLFEYRPGAS